MIARLREVPWHALREEIVVPAVEAVLAGRPAERVVDRALRGLGREERAAAAEAIFGVALWRRRLRRQGASSGRELVFALLAGLAGQEPADAARWCGLPGPPSLDLSEPERLADRWSLPDWLEELLLRELGAEAGAFCAAISVPGPICLRANRLKCTREELAARLPWKTRPALRAKDALFVDERAPNLFGEQSWREGWFEPQDEGSQLLGLFVRAEPGDSVLDFCAGAGGKTLLVAAELQNRGLVLAHDPDAFRLDRLRTRTLRAGASCVQVGAPRVADRVLVDAPCSEIGVLRRGPDARWRAPPIPVWPERQLAILEAAAPFARKRLVYATCTVVAEENQGVAERFELRHPEWHRTETLVLLPHRDGTDGFFAAAWER